MISGTFLDYPVTERPEEAQEPLSWQLSFGIVVNLDGNCPNATPYVGRRALNDLVFGPLNVDLHNTHITPNLLDNFHE